MNRKGLKNQKGRGMQLSNSKKAGLFVGFSAVALSVGGGAFYYQKFMKGSVEGSDRTPQSKSKLLHQIGRHDWQPPALHREGPIMDRRGQDLQGLSFDIFSNRDLREVDFSHANASGANFQRSVLAGQALNSTNFDGAKMQGVRIIYGPCSLTSFKKAKLQHGKFEDMRFEGVDFSGANLTEADLFGAEMISMVDSNVVKHTKLSGAKLYKANISEAELRDVEGRGANFQYAQMRGTEIIGGDFRGADFRNVYPLPSFQNVLIDETTQFGKAQNRILNHAKRNQEDGNLYLTYDPRRVNR